MKELTQQQREFLSIALDNLEDLIIENNYLIWIDFNEVGELKIKLTKEGEEIRITHINKGKTAA